MCSSGTEDSKDRRQRLQTGRASVETRRADAETCTASVRTPCANGEYKRRKNGFRAAPHGSVPDKNTIFAFTRKSNINTATTETYTRP